MARVPNDILIPTDLDPVDHRPGRSNAAAFVPITLAIVGVAAILLGGVSAPRTEQAAIPQYDPIETGSIAR
ncbi:MAG TPA: hypothetical protein VFB16_05345 [Bauldia sp.]|nr:hypothetical protein [Bauldia sp.]